MCNLYTMTATVDELRRVFGSFDGKRENLPPFDQIYGRATSGTWPRMLSEEQLQTRR